MRGSPFLGYDSPSSPYHTVRTHHRRASSMRSEPDDVEERYQLELGEAPAESPLVDDPGVNVEDVLDYRGPTRPLYDERNETMYDAGEPEPSDEMDEEDGPAESSTDPDRLDSMLGSLSIRPSSAAPRDNDNLPPGSDDESDLGALMPGPVADDTPAPPVPAWVYPRDPRTPQVNAPYTIYLPHPCMRLDLFYRRPDALVQIAKAPVVALLELLGQRNTASPIAFAEATSGRISAKSPKYLAMSLAPFANVPADIVGAPASPLPKTYAVSPTMFLVANTIDRALRAAWLAAKHVPGLADDAARAQLDALQRALGAPLSERTLRLNNPGAYDEIPRVKVVDAVMIAPLEGGNVPPADFYFTRARPNPPDLLDAALAQLLRYTQPPIVRNENTHPVFMGSEFGSLRLARHRVSAGGDSDAAIENNTALKFGELVSHPDWSTTLNVHGADRPPYAIRATMLALKVIKTPAGYTSRNDSAGQITIFQLPLWAIFDAYCDALATRAPGPWPYSPLTDPFQVIHARAVLWHVMCDDVRHPLTYMYALPASFVRVLMHAAYGPVRVYAADCILSYGAAEFRVRPSLAAARLLIEALDALAEISADEYRLTYYLPESVAMPAAMVSLDAMEQFAMWYDEEYTRTDAATDAMKADVLLAAVVAFGRGRLPADWLDKLYELVGTPLKESHAPRMFHVEKILNKITGRTPPATPYGTVLDRPTLLKTMIKEMHALAGSRYVPDERKKQLLTIQSVQPALLGVGNLDGAVMPAYDRFENARTFGDVISATTDMQAIVERLSPQKNAVLRASPYWQPRARARMLGESHA